MESMFGLGEIPGGTPLLPYGGVRHSSLKFVDWYHLGCYNIK